MGISPAVSRSTAQVAEANPVSNERIVMSVAGSEFEISLYDNTAAHALFESLPRTIGLTRWGDGEYYGPIGAEIPSSGAKREYFDRGEVALWPEGNAFCVFFGRTPMSADARPRMDSPGVPFGRITKGDVAAFRTMGGTISAVLRRGRETQTNVNTEKPGADLSNPVSAGIWSVRD